MSEKRPYLQPFIQSVALHLLIVIIAVVGFFQWERKEIKPPIPKFIAASLVEKDTLDKPAKRKKKAEPEKPAQKPVPEKPEPPKPEVKPEPPKPEVKPEPPKPEVKPEPPKPEVKPEIKKPEPPKPEIKKPEPKKPEPQKEIVEKPNKKPEPAKPEVVKKEEPKKKPESKPKKEWGMNNLDSLLEAEEDEIQGKKRKVQENAEREQESQDEVDEYSILIRQAIERSWVKPASVRESLQVTLRIAMLPGGEVFSVDVVTSSGNNAFDRSAIVAVQRAHILPVPKDRDIFDRNFRKLLLVFNPDDF